MESRYPPTEELRLLEGFLSSGADKTEELSLLLADDCVVFGSTGRRYNKQQILEAIKQSGRSKVALSEFHARYLGSNVALVTYRARRHSDATFRVFNAFFDMEKRK